MEHKNEIRVAIMTNKVGRLTPEARLASKMFEAKSFDITKLPVRSLHLTEAKPSLIDRSGLPMIKVEHKSGVIYYMHNLKSANEAIDDLKDLDDDKMSALLAAEYVPISEENGNNPSFEEGAVYNSDIGVFTYLTDDGSVAYLTDTDNEPIEMPLELWKDCNPTLDKLPAAPKELNPSEEPVIEDGTQVSSLVQPVGPLHADYRDKYGKVNTVSAANEQELEKKCNEVEKDPDFVEFTDFYKDEDPAEDPLYAEDPKEEEDDVIPDNHPTPTNKDLDTFVPDVFITDIGVLHDMHNGTYLFIDTGEKIDMTEDEFSELNPIPLVPDTKK